MYASTKAASAVSGSSIPDSQVSESRKRQSKKDDAIRRKIEHDLSKKKRQSTRTNRSKKGAPGTVLSLHPSEPIICKPSSTVYEVSQIMTAKRENCILVVSDVGELLGIFTAKDLAFRVVGSGLAATNVTIDQIMTPEPMCASSNTPASDALNLMVERGFRHLPVLDEQTNQIVGVLDITKCYAQQMEKLERMHSSSKKLYEALDSVHSEMGMHQQPLHVFQYFETLKLKMNGPTLESVLDASTIPVYANVKTSVHEATILMKEHHTTAVLVKDSSDEVSGIFTSKDVVLRVIAAGLDPKKCSIVRVMTPLPDVALQKVSIQAALRKMFDGHYLNLPVVDEEVGQIIGIVDVLRLTYTTLNQIKLIEAQPVLGDQVSAGDAKEEGPAWNKFWTSLDNDDTESLHSDSMGGSGMAVPDITASEFNSFNVDNIKPSDSISYISTGRSSRKPKTVAETAADALADAEGSEAPLAPLVPLVDEAAAKAALLSTEFVFKFRSPAVEGRVHRIAVVPADGVCKLRELIDSKLSSKDVAFLAGEHHETYAISYIDDEGDVVSITSDHDLVECVRISRLLRADKADLYLHNPHEPARGVPLVPVVHSAELIAGVPNEILIPGVLGVLATAIVLGLSLSRR